MPPVTPSTALKDLLTAKELSVAKLVMEGHSNAEIAVELGVKTRTIAAHMCSIFKKLGFNNRVQLATKYLMECGPDA